MSRKKQLNLTEGPILRTLTELALPIMASSFLSTAYNITDMAWIGTLGAKAVAGVGVGGMYVWLSSGLAALSRMGGQVNVSQCCGRKAYEEAKNYASASLQLTMLLGILFGAICTIFANPLVGFFQLGDPDTIKDAKTYLIITCGLILFSFLNLTLTGIFTAQGDSKTPFKANLTGLVINMILDPVLILGIGPFPRLEVSGAAIATVSAQILVFAVLVFFIMHSNPKANILKSVKLGGFVGSTYYHSIFKIGIPTALQSSIYCFISMVLTRMVSDFGPGAVATQRVGGQIESLSWNTAEGFGSAINAFTGQNYGAKKHDRIKKGYNISFILLAIWGLLISLAFIFFPEQISRCFFHEEDVIAISVDYLIIIGLSQCFMSEELMTIGALSGLGKTNICSVISILLTGSRIPLALLFIHIGMGISGVWWALSVSSIIKGIVFYFTFQYISTKERNRFISI